MEKVSLDAAPITVLGEGGTTRESSPAGKGEQTASPPAAGNRRRRTGIAFITATGVVALAAAPFAMVAPQEHFTGESASSPITTHRKPAAKNSATDKKVLITPPDWKSQGSSQQPPTLPSQAVPPAVPGQVAPDLPTPWVTPSDSPPAGSDPSSDPSPSPSTSPVPKRQTLAQEAPAVPLRSPSATAAEHVLKPDRETPLKPQQPAKPAKSATPNWRTHVIHGTYVLQPGQNVHSNRMRLALQTDGDLVLRDEHDRVVWSTGTHQASTHVVFQADGNFVLYSSTNATLWSTRTDGHDGAVLVLRANGDMAITQGSTVLWHTNTAK